MRPSGDDVLGLLVDEQDHLRRGIIDGLDGGVGDGGGGLTLPFWTIWVSACTISSYFLANAGVDIAVIASRFFPDSGSRSWRV